MDAMLKVKFLSIVGKIMANPEEFKRNFEYTLADEGTAGMAGTFRLKGEIAELLRGSDVQKALVA